MRSLKLILTVPILAVGMTIYGQFSEITKSSKTNFSEESTNALFDPLFNYQVGMETGTNGNAGVIFISNEFWVSSWSSDQIFVLDEGGNYIEDFTIPGISGVRSMTTDGDMVYFGDASNNIYEVDPNIRTLNKTIICKPTTDALSRMTAFDAELNNGKGGFYISDFNSDISALDRDGNELFVISNSNYGGSGVYGGAVDHYTNPGTAYLWVFEQIDGAQSIVRQIELPSGNPTGISYNYNQSELQSSDNKSVAGGLFIVNDWNGKVAIVGLGQGAMYDQLFGIELSEKSKSTNKKILTAHTKGSKNVTKRM